MTSRPDPLTLCISAAGGRTMLARALTYAGYQVSPNTINGWVVFPRRRVNAIARALKVAPEKLLTDEQRMRRA